MEKQPETVYGSIVLCHSVKPDEKFPGDYYHLTRAGNARFAAHYGQPAWVSFDAFIELSFIHAVERTCDLELVLISATGVEVGRMDVEPVEIPSGFHTFTTWAIVSQLQLGLGAYLACAVIEKTNFVGSTLFAVEPFPLVPRSEAPKTPTKRHGPD